jgi:hypothetical protein
MGFVFIRVFDVGLILLLGLQYDDHVTGDSCEFACFNVMQSAEKPPRPLPSGIVDQ